MIKQIIFDNASLLTNDEKNSILNHHLNKTASIDDLSRVLGIDTSIICNFISDYEKRLRDKT